MVFEANFTEDQRRRDKKLNMEVVKKQPKAFVSYSWQPDENKEKVKNIVDRLRDHGIDAILDIYKLNVGHDKNAYMERMVTDTTIDKVLVFSNKIYTEKANEKKGGVGTETIIISKEVYESVTQDKFIPILMERDEDGKEYFPAFINSRIYIDFSDNEIFEDEYEKLVKIIYGKPIDKEPALGKAPSFVTEENPFKLRVHRKLDRFKKAVIEGKDNVQVLIEDYFEIFIEDLSNIKIEDYTTQDKPFDQSVYEAIVATKPLRDNFLDFFEVIIKLNEDNYKELLHNHISSWNELITLEGRCTHHYKFFFKELFQYIVTISLSKEKFILISYLVNMPYWINRGSNYNVTNFTFVYANLEILDKDRNQRLNENRLSVATDILVKRIDYKKINLDTMRETDLLLFFLHKLTHKLKIHSFWFPYLSMYGGDECISYMRRAESKIFFEKIKIIFNVETREELLTKINSIPRRDSPYQYGYEISSIEVGLNINKLANY